MAQVLPPPLYARLYQFRRAELAGLPFEPAQVDAELDRVKESLNQSVSMLRGITDANGRLKLQTPLREMKLIEVLSFIATAGQTQFYIAPITDVLTDRAEFHIEQSNRLYYTLDQSLVSMAAATTSGAGSITAVASNSIYTVSGTLPDTLVGATAVVNGVDIGVVTARLTATTFQTNTPWPLANATYVAAQWTWGNLGFATIAPVVPLVAGQRVQVFLNSDGAGALTQLGSASATTGARQVAVFDFGNIIGSANVEDALQEIFTLYNALSAALGPISQYVKRDGSLAMTGDLDGGGNKGVGFVPGTAAGELVTYDQVASFIAVWNDLQQFYLKRDGSTAMAGNLNLGGNRAVNMDDGVDPNDGVNVTQLSERIHKDGSVAMEADLDLNGHNVTGAVAAVEPDQFVTLEQLQQSITGGTNLKMFQAAGPWTYTVPSGVTFVDAELWGGGAPGGTHNGGSAGGYLKARIAVSAGDVLSGQVGAGGPAATPVNGGTTTLLLNAVTLFSVTGGLYGPTAVGGIGSALTGLDFLTIQGGIGHRGTFVNASGINQFGGANGADGPRGGGGGGSLLGDNGAVSRAATAGGWPGAGGGGFSPSIAASTPADGANGGVVIQF